MKKETETIENSEVPNADPELGRLSAENEELRNELRMRTAIYDIETKLAATGARSPGLLAESAREGFQFGDDGKLSNPEALVDNLRRSYPEQFGGFTPAGSIDAGAGRNAAPPLTRDALANMSVADVQQLDWETIKEVLSVK